MKSNAPQSYGDRYGTLRYRSFATPVGQLWVAYEAGSVALSMLATDERTFLDRCITRLGTTPVRDSDPTSVPAQAIAARLESDAPLDFMLAGRTAFQQAVLGAVAGIPRGQTRTYGEVATAVGRPGAARAVGEVMRSNYLPVLIPCHRVVRTGGDIGRYTPHPALKRALLRAEGALPPD